MVKLSPKRKNILKTIIGFTPSETDFLLLPSWPADSLCLTAAASVEDSWVSSFLPAGQILRYKVSDKIGSLENVEYDELIANSDFTSVIKKSGINKMWLITNVDNMDYLARWSAKNRIKIITADFKLQPKIENKIWFDEFLKHNQLPSPASQIVDPINAKIKLGGQLVLQEALTAGGEGTFFLKKPEDMKTLIRTGRILKNKQYLLREFVSGRPLGITVFIAPHQLYLSQLRLQCFSAQKSGERHFSGIQWISDSKFSAATLKKINFVFQKAGQKLRKLGYLGFANFDFILTPDNQVLIIECNPRFSAATAQLLKFSDFGSKINFWSVFLGNKTRYPEKNYLLGRRGFRGATLELSWQPARSGSKKVISGLHKNGVYCYNKGSIKFLTSDPRKFGAQRREFLFMSLMEPGEKLTQECPLGQIITNFPLYTDQGKLKPEGKILKNFFI